MALRLAFTMAAKSSPALRVPTLPMSMSANPDPLCLLPDVTLCCVDTRSPTVSVAAMRRSMARCRFGRVMFFGDAIGLAADLDLKGIEFHQIKRIQNIREYSNFILKLLPYYISTSHVLIMQWDGFVVDASRWREEFLEYDYIGAPWFHEKFNRLVGNGGFSLRSKRLLELTVQADFGVTGPEDVCICVHHRADLERRHAIRFASVEVAGAFSTERGAWRSSFGFHGVFNCPEFMSSVELNSYLRSLPSELTLSPDMRDLMKKLLRKNEFGALRILLRKRIRLQGLTFDNILFCARLLRRKLLLHVTNAS